MKPLSEILENINKAVELYDSCQMSRIDISKQSQVLQSFTVCIWELSQYFDEVEIQWVEFRKSCSAKHEATKNRETDEAVPEYQLVKRKLDILEQMAKSVSQTISANKNQG